jgi:hypothetical protein
MAIENLYTVIDTAERRGDQNGAVEAYRVSYDEGWRDPQ